MEKQRTAFHAGGCVSRVGAGKETASHGRMWVEMASHSINENRVAITDQAASGRNDQR